jgi:hypothetical protein
MPHEQERFYNITQQRLSSLKTINREGHGEKQSQFTLTVLRPAPE